jgi:type II secretory pathway component PulM
MSFLLVLIGLAMMVLSFLVAARMTGAVPRSRRLCAASPMGAGAMLVLAEIARPDLMPGAVVLTVLSLVWLLLSRPPELARGRRQEQQ